jgi:hypothetical protein
LLLWALLLLCGAAAAAEVGVATLVDPGSRVLRGATWYKLVPGARLEEGDILDVADGAQAQIELSAGSTANVVGAGLLHIVRAGAGAPATLALYNAWAKVAAKTPGVRIQTPQAAVITADGTVVFRSGNSMFVESGAARLIQLTASGSEGPGHDMKRGEHWSKSASGTYAMVPRAPKEFVEAMPRAYFDALPVLADRYKAKPTLVVERDITYAEAEPWLAGRDRAAFERRFASRLRDPAFRRAVEPYVARYPSWDRMLHPEKYAPKPPAAPDLSRKSQ